MGHWENGAMIKEWLLWDHVTCMKQIAMRKEEPFENTRSIRLVYNKIKRVLIQLGKERRIEKRVFP